VTALSFCGPWSGRLNLRDAVGFRTRLVRGGCHDDRMGHGLSLAPDNRRGCADTVVAATGRLRDAGQSMNQRDRLLPDGCRASRLPPRHSALLAPVRLSQPCRCRGGQGSARNGRRVLQENLALHDRRLRLASGRGRAHRGHRSARDRGRQTVHSALHGSRLHPWHAFGHPYALGTGGLVRAGGRAVPGDAAGDHRRPRR